MLSNSNSFRYIKKIMKTLICLVMIMIVVFPMSAHAEDTGKTVRVGWYESPFNTTDQFGRKSGYAYDYQQKIAAYTGWKYEYVEGSWPELMQMLVDGEIDLMSDVSYTEERAENMLFSSLQMGAEEYYIYISPNNIEINKDDFSTFNGKKVGANKGSVQIGFFRDWAKANNVQAELIEMTEGLDESIDMLNRGDIDMYVIVDGYIDASLAMPICKVGASDFFFAVNKERPDLQAELNAAMNRIQEEDHNYNQQLYEKYFKAFGYNYYLSTEEKAWLSKHGKIRVGYLDNYLAFCDADDNTGELTGALKDYLSDASEKIRNGNLEFEPIVYPTVDTALEALKNGEVDCMFPSNLSISDGESLGLVMTPSIMSTEIYTIVRKADQGSFSQKEQITIAVEKGNQNYGSIIKDHFASWQQKEYNDIESCLKAVANGEVDCFLVSNYRYNKLAKQCEKFKLTALATGEDVDFYIAVKDGNTGLYSILTRTTDVVNSASVNAALSYYSAAEARTTLIDLINENPIVVVAIIFVIVALLTIIVAQRRMLGARKEIKESQHKVADLSKRVYIDALTSVRNKGGFNEYTQSIQDRINQGEKLEFAAIVLDCNGLKQVNDQYGHDKGDIYIKNVSRLICRVYKHSPVFRIGGDEFAVILQNEDYENRFELKEQFEKSAKEIRDSAENYWEKVSVSSGMAEYDPLNDNFVDDVVRRADKLMYDNKRTFKV